MSRRRRLGVALEAPAQQLADGGRACRPAARPVGFALRTAASVSVTVSPSKAACPVSISKSTQPKAQMSVRLSTACRAPARAHVGGRARGSRRPRVGGASVGDRRRGRVERRRLASRRALARPKSSTFTLPSGVSFTFAGLRSRWTMPFSCAASSASAICRAIGRRLVERRARPRVSRSARSSPSTSSITRSAATPSDVLEVRRSCAMFGWLSEASSCASRSKRASALGVRGERGGQHLDRDVAVRASCRARGTPRPCRPRRSRR